MDEKLYATQDLYRQYRSLMIRYLLADNEYFEEKCKQINEALSGLPQSEKQNKATKNVATFVILSQGTSDPTDRLAVFVGVDNQNNPYLFIYNIKDQVLSNVIDHKTFDLLLNPYILYEIKYKATNIRDFKDIINPGIIEKMETLAKIHDSCLLVKKSTKDIPVMMSTKDKNNKLYHYDSHDEINL